MSFLRTAAQAHCTNVVLSQSDPLRMRVVDEGGDDQAWVEGQARARQRRLARGRTPFLTTSVTAASSRLGDYAILSAQVLQAPFTAASKQSTG